MIVANNFYSCEIHSLTSLACVTSPQQALHYYSHYSVQNRLVFYTLRKLIDVAAYRDVVVHVSNLFFSVVLG